MGERPPSAGMYAVRPARLCVAGGTPCGDCPYRRDAPLGHWSPEEFIELERSDMDPTSPMYGCHKKDGTLCRGWLMDQRERDVPNLSLRMQMGMVRGFREVIASVHCPVPRWPSIRVMAQANGVADMTLHGLAERVASSRECDDVDPDDPRSMLAAAEAWSEVASGLSDHVLLDHWWQIKLAMDEAPPEDEGALPE